MNDHRNWNANLSEFSSVTADAITSLGNRPSVVTVMTKPVFHMGANLKNDHCDVTKSPFPSDQWDQSSFTCLGCPCSRTLHDDVIKWKNFPRYWPFVRGIHRSPVNSPLKGEWRGALMFSLICVWINDWVNNGEAGDLRRYRAHYDVTVMCIIHIKHARWWWMEWLCIPDMTHKECCDL